ncbi:integrase core domain-containing protein [Streptomyces sp. NBC_00727]
MYDDAGWVVSGVTPEIPTPGRWMFRHPGEVIQGGKAEELFAVLKAEIGTTAWETRAQARQDVFRWIAEHYNRERIHSTIGYITPYQARVRCHQRLDLAA